MGPHGQQPTRLPCPWDSPGKNTGVVAISFSSAWKWKVKVKSLSRVGLVVTPWTAAYQAPLSMGFSRQEYWSGVPLPSPWVYATQAISFLAFKWILLKLWTSAFALFKRKKRITIAGTPVSSNLPFASDFVYLQAYYTRRSFMASAVKSRVCGFSNLFFPYRNFNHPDLKIRVTLIFAKGMFFKCCLASSFIFLKLE